MKITVSQLRRIIKEEVGRARRRRRDLVEMNNYENEPWGPAEYADALADLMDGPFDTDQDHDASIERFIDQVRGDASLTWSERKSFLAAAARARRQLASGTGISFGRPMTPTGRIPR